MDRRAIAAVGIYAALVLSLLTPLYSPLSSGRDDSWALLALLAAAHLGLGAAIRRAWVLALPVAVSVVAFLAAGAEGLAWLAILLGAPVLVALTAVGSALGRAFRQQGDAIVAGFFVIALVPAAWGAVETSRRGPHVPASVQSQLPTEISLGNLCPGTQTSADLEQDVRRRAEVLIRELRERPTHLVTYTYSFSDGDDERRDITIRELAEEQPRTSSPAAPTAPRPSNTASGQRCDAIIAPSRAAPLASPGQQATEPLGGAAPRASMRQRPGWATQSPSQHDPSG